MKYRKKREIERPPAVNGRFCEMAALAPQKRQCELGSYYPAESLVKPPPRKAAGTMYAIPSGLRTSGGWLHRDVLRPSGLRTSPVLRNSGRGGSPHTATAQSRPPVGCKAS